MTELLDVKPQDVRPFDLLDEGSVVRSIEWPRGLATVGTLRFELIDGPDGEPVKYPVWENVRHIQLGDEGTWRVLRGAATNIATEVATDRAGDSA